MTALASDCRAKMSLCTLSYYSTSSDHESIKNPFFVWPSWYLSRDWDLPDATDSCRLIFPEEHDTHGRAWWLFVLPRRPINIFCLLLRVMREGSQEKNALVLLTFFQSSPILYFLNSSYYFTPCFLFDHEAFNLVSTLLFHCCRFL